MRMMLSGFAGWMRMDSKSESIRVVDTVITVVATLLVAVTWAMFR